MGENKNPNENPRNSQLQPASVGAGLTVRGESVHIPWQKLPGYEAIQEELLTETGKVAADLTHLKLDLVINHLSRED